jgi:SAM-dependent methyltransferase
MSLSEDSYGRAKRLAFVAQIVRAQAPRDILDIGCGTGTQLTLPLAAAFPQIEIVGVDEDARSIAWARENARAANLRFLAAGELPADRRFGLVIASEVLEHVGEPGRFLRALRDRLAPGARLVLTVPNGFGTFELLALIEVALNLSGAQRLIRRLRGRREPETVPTLATSPHVNFFGFGELGRLFAEAGLAVRRYRARTLLCGYLLDSALRGRRFLAWNAGIADRLPPWCASDWMFELEPVRAPAAASAWRRGLWAAWRKRLNERRWGLA